MMLLRVVIAVIKIAQEIELQIVRVAFDRLQSRIHLARGLDVGSFAQLFHHREHGFRRLIEQFDLFAKAAAVQILRTNQNALADFLDRLRNFIERRRERLNVFAFQRRDERLRKRFRQFLRDAFIFAPAVGERVETLRRIALLQFLQQIDQMMHAVVGLLRAALEQIEKFFVVSEKFADGKHKRSGIKALTPRMSMNATLKETNSIELTRNSRNTTQAFGRDFYFSWRGLVSFLFRLAPKMKRVGEHNIAEKIVARSVIDVERGIQLEIARDVAGESDRR